MSATVLDHDAPTSAAITAELVRLSLGLRGPQRIELDVSPIGRVTNAFRLMQTTLAEALLPLVHDLSEALSRVGKIADFLPPDLHATTDTEAGA